MNIERIGNNAIVEAGQTAFTFAISENPRDFNSFRVSQDSLDWVDKDYFIGQFRIHPYGDNNNLDKEIQRVVQNGSDAPGQMTRKFQMLWGKGPKLYIEKLKDGEYIKEWTEDADVQAWLDSWEYEEYLQKAAVDYNHLQGHYTKNYRYRGVRVKMNNKIAKLEHIPFDRARLASLLSDDKRKADYVAVTDFSFETLNALLDTKIYAKLDPLNPLKYRNSIYYSNMYSFCQDYYTVPDIYGTLEWLRRSNAIPLIFKAISKQSINASYHIESPQAYWDVIEEKLIKNCEQRGVAYKNWMLEDYETQVLKGITEVLSSEKNAGKFWHTKKTLQVDGNNLLEHGWTITPIDRNMKDFVKAQIELSNHASKKVSTSIGVHSAIGGSQDTKVNSGAEQHYAVQNYLLTQNDVPDMIVTKMLNMALKINFPEKGIKIGFYHIGSKKLQDVTPGDRPINQDPN